MSLQRKHSKTVAAANRVVWTGREVLPVAYTLNGLVTDGAELGIFRVTGRPLYCNGFTAFFQTPSADRYVNCSVEMQTGSGVAVPGGLLRLNGVTAGGEKQFKAVPMPSGSLWKMVVRSAAVNVEDLPQGLTVTYQLRYANGPVRTDFWTNGLVSEGIGFWQIDDNFVVE